MDADMLLVTKAVQGGRKSWDQMHTDGVTREHIEGDGIRVYDWVQDRVDSGSFPDVSELATFAGGLPDPADYRWGTLVRAVRERRIGIMMDDCAAKVREMVGRGDYLAAFQRMQAAVHAAEREGEADFKVRSLLALGPKVQARLQAVKDGTMGIASPWSILDGMTGRFQRRSVTTFVARPGIGKTATGILAARHAWGIGGKSVSVVSPEMDDDEVAEVFYVIHSQISFTRLVMGELSAEEEDRLNQTVESVKALEGLYVLDSAQGITPGSVQRFVDASEPDMLDFDSMYEAFKGEFPKEYDRLEFTTGLLKDMSKRNRANGGIAVVANSQFSRDAGEGGAEGSLENIGKNDIIAQRSNNCFGLYRKIPDDIRNKVLRIKPLKIRRRAGWVDEMLIRWDWDGGKFEEIQPRQKFEDTDKW